MSPAYWVIFLSVLGVALLFAELLLPTHGVLGLLGLFSFGGAIAACFYINQWLGLSVFLTAVVISPFIAAWVVKMWPRTPIGKGLIIGAVTPAPEAPPIRVGQTGVVTSELRPGGECEFGDLRVEAIAEYGVIAAGKEVRIVAFSTGRPVVRPVTASKEQLIQ